jgi:hypothetical protein
MARAKPELRPRCGIERTLYLFALCPLLSSGKVPATWLCRIPVSPFRRKNGRAPNFEFYLKV